MLLCSLMKKKLKPMIFLQSDTVTSICILHLKGYAHHLSGVQFMAIISLQCNSLSQIHSSVYFRLKIHSMTGRGYMGEALIQVCLKSIRK